MTPAVKRGLHWLGSALAFIGIIFVFSRVRQYSGQIDIANIADSIWAAVAGLSLVYGLINWLLARAWWHLLNWLSAITSPQWAFKVYGTSQLAKYLPGNIFHLAGRQVLGMAAGVPAGALAKSTVWELGLISLSAATFGTLVLPLVISFSVSLSAIGFVLAIGLGALLVRRYLDEQCVYSWFYYSGFLLVSGTLFFVLLHLIAGVSYVLWLTVTAAFVLAWLAGLLTPGAPAGLGVREMVLFFLLKGLVTEADLLLTIVLSRLVTVVGDMLFYLAATIVSESFIEKK